MLSSLAGLRQELEEGAVAKRLGELVEARAFPHVHKDQTLDWRLSAWERPSSNSCPLLAAPTYTSSKAS